MSLNPTASAKSGIPALTARLKAAVQSFGALARQPAVRRALPSVILLGVSALAVVVWLALRDTPRSTLYPGLAEAEKARVIEVLNARSINAALDEQTGEVTVLPADYHRARLALAAEGLPQSVPDGSNVIADLPMGASQAVEGIRLRQAQELDLAQTIAEIGPVVSARVHLALPEKSAFLRDSHPPGASVLLMLAAGRTLDPGQVEAIVHLVSSSVPGMAQSAVTVVDERGRLLSEGGDNPDSLMTDRQLRQRTALEDLMRSRIEAVLSPVVGPGNLSVQVNTEMDFTRREVTEERVDPNGNALRSEQINESLSASSPAGGIPGAVSNTPPAEPDLSTAAPPTGAAGGAPASTPADPAAENAGATAGPVQTQTTGSTRNFEVSRTVSSTKGAVGTVTRLSAAIVLHAQPDADPDTEAATLADLRRLAESAVGFDAGRGDMIEIVRQPFAVDPGAVSAPGPDLEWLPGALREVGLIVALAVIGLGVMRPLLMHLIAPPTPAIAPPAAAGLIESTETPLLEDLAQKGDGNRKDLAASVLGSQAGRAEKQAALRQLAASDPQLVATVLHRMMRTEVDSVQ